MEGLAIAQAQLLNLFAKRYFHAMSLGLLLQSLL
jgi:hypothetical protein